ncbi:MAG: class I SAM-dependent methyltransferase, partial [Ilumatobacteraceae bacterium]
MRFARVTLRFCINLIRAVKRPLTENIQKKQISKVEQIDLVEQQVQLFRALGLDWNAANQIVVELDGAVPAPGSHRSQHFEVFVALGIKLKPTRILEIGTGEATFAAFLSSAFPKATIESIDLPDDNKRFWNAIDSQKVIAADEMQSDSVRLSKRNENLKKSPNVNFRELNSLALSRSAEEEFDLIWVDGDHTFPIVACDIANAVRLLKPNGTLVCDDVYLADGGINGGWGSQETQRALQ